MIQKTFKRYEKKYLLSPQQYRMVRQGIQERMQLDQYGLYTICSIYFDTDNFQLIRSSLEKPVYKEKLRLRSYGVPEDAQSPVFLELKKKYKGVVYKRRVDMQLEECREYLFAGERGRSCTRSTGSSTCGTPLPRSFWPTTAWPSSPPRRRSCASPLTRTSAGATPSSPSRTATGAIRSCRMRWPTTC